eukprot:5887041-Karenia_brevis.AAC.1
MAELCDRLNGSMTVHTERCQSRAWDVCAASASKSLAGGALIPWRWWWPWHVKELEAFHAECVGEPNWPCNTGGGASLEWQSSAQLLTMPLERPETISSTSCWN